MKLHYNPLSSYSQKTLTALHEKEVEFTPAIVDFRNPEQAAAYKALYPLGKVPLLVLPDGWMIPESTIIIEYLDTHFDTGTRLIPADKDLARRVRFMDRQADLYLNDKMTTILFDGWKPEADRNPKAVAAARATLDTMYDYLDPYFAKNTWAAGAEFSMADCAMAPALAYLRQVHPYTSRPNLTSYLGRLVERPSFAKVLAHAAPFMQPAAT